MSIYKFEIRQIDKTKITNLDTNKSYALNLPSFGQGASKSTTQGGTFYLLLYVTFDCAGIAAFQKYRCNAHVQVR